MEAQRICQASITSGTRSQYEAHIRGFTQFRGSNSLIIPVKDGIEYLTTLFSSGKSYSTINSARSALSQFTQVDTGSTPFGSHPLTVKFMRGVFKLRPTSTKYTSTWDVGIVFNLFRSWPENEKLSLKQLTMKTVMLVALTAGQRIQAIAAMSWENASRGATRWTFIIGGIMKTTRPSFHNPPIVLLSFEAETKLCVLSTMSTYRQRLASLGLELTGPVFVTYNKPHRTAAQRTISRWITVCLQEAGLEGYGAHSTRHAASSKAAAHAPTDSILRTVGWTSEETFRRFYLRDITADHPQTFSQAVLT